MAVLYPTVTVLAAAFDSAPQTMRWTLNCLHLVALAMDTVGNDWAPEETPFGDRAGVLGDDVAHLRGWSPTPCRV